MPLLEGVTPPGMEDVVQELKEQGDVDNPWAVAWWIYNRQKGQARRLTAQEIAECVQEYRAFAGRRGQADTFVAAARGEGWAHAVLLSQAVGQPVMMYREQP
jgi:hypothetical protein